MLETDQIAELRARLVIDKYDLDTELIQQPSLLDEVGEQHEKAITRRESAKIEVERAEALADQEIREDFAKDKLSETDIKKKVALDPKVLQAQNTYLSWREMAGRWNVLHDAVQQRSYVLSKLVELFIANYYQTNSISVERADARDRTADTARDTMAGERERRGPFVRRASQAS